MTLDEMKEFDDMFYAHIDKGYRPDETDRHGDDVPKDSNETKLERLIRERKEKYDVRT